MESDKIIHDTYNYLVCNICNEEEIFETNTNGVCCMCADNRVEDGIWTEKQRYSDDLRTNQDGEIKIS